MKLVFMTISAVLLVAGSAAQALPGIDQRVTPTAAAPVHIEPVRLVCNYRRCFRTGYRYYRPYYGYRYYRPGIGIGIGPFGVGVY